MASPSQNDWCVHTNMNRSTSSRNENVSVRYRVEETSGHVLAKERYSLGNTGCIWEQQVGNQNMDDDTMAGKME